MLENLPEIWMYHAGMASQVLGPGRRLVFWLSGCPLRCPGCIEPGRWQIGSGKPEAVDQLFEGYRDAIMRSDGITFSGGEPLYQAAALERFLTLIPASVDKMLFTGYQRHELDGRQTALYDAMDLCVAGRFDSRRVGNFLWRGSGNQDIVSPTGKYCRDTLERWKGQTSAGVQVHVVDRQVFIYGIPTPGTLDNLHAALMKQGIMINPVD